LRKTFRTYLQVEHEWSSHYNGLPLGGPNHACLVTAWTKQTTLQSDSERDTPNASEEDNQAVFEHNNKKDPENMEKVAAPKDKAL